MPEGDVVWQTARRLHEALAGRPLTRSDFRVPRLATADLRGRTVLEAVARGKHLLVRVDGGVTVHTHLKMDGVWRVRRAAGPPPRDHRIRLVLGNAEWLALGYRLGTVNLLRTAEEHRAVGHLGPDLLDADWGPGPAAEAVRRLAEQPARPIGEALLDQTRLAGIGNVYKAEVLFLRGVHPWTPVGDVPDLPDLVDLAHRLLDANRDRRGHITTGDRRPGREHWVYGRAGLPCRRCGTRVRRADQGPDAAERVTFWCPHCQPAPAGGA
ncbi:putative endonuclease 8 2 [Actinomadura sp. NBRC 104425]|uniref:DNA-formamidopyrimidine glycosylase family protein n=1 Tax=Actinomadura sp. NBRC 104425 TaxID=3032204 RepID=UPI0024A2FF78|nr:DNA-formamidopyrimidine glycosylase family protein [Actinomadura sp. NBRC 104425]GLZ11107.1 putative endonuclease 8 2 [Actinomadura sp. NBRC 104425]